MPMGVFSGNVARSNGDAGMKFHYHEQTGMYICVFASLCVINPFHMRWARVYTFIRLYEITHSNLSLYYSSVLRVLPGNIGFSDVKVRKSFKMSLYSTLL